MTDNQGVLLCSWARTPARACACVIWLTAQQRVWMDSVKAQTLMQLHTGRFMMWNTKGNETMITFMRCHFPALLSEEFVEFYASFFPIMCPPCPKWAFVRGLCLQRLDLILSNKAQVGCLYSSICPHTCTYLSCIVAQFYTLTWELQSLIFQNETVKNTFLSSFFLKSVLICHLWYICVWISVACAQLIYSMTDLCLLSRFMVSRLLETSQVSVW